MLWGEEQIANAANALQSQVGQLRRTLGATAIVTSEAGYALGIGPDDLDAARFEQLVAKGRRLLEEGETALASSMLRQALQLPRGEPLGEFAYVGFADAERAHLDDLALAAIEARAEADLALKIRSSGSHSRRTPQPPLSSRHVSFGGSATTTEPGHHENYPQPPARARIPTKRAQPALREPDNRAPMPATVSTAMPGHGSSLDQHDTTSLLCGW